jgi:hypothetical protein
VSAETVSMVIGYLQGEVTVSSFQAGTGTARNFGKGIPIQCNVHQKRYVCVSAETVYGYRVNNEKQLCLRFRRERERQGILVKESRFSVMYSKKGMSVCLLKLCVGYWLSCR